MIRYALACVAEHGFDAWFRDSAAWDEQSAAGLVACPHCGSTEVRKQIMAPAVVGGASARSPAAELAALAGKVRRRIAETHDYVGDRFADEARAIHAGEAPHRLVWGEVTPEQARELKQEGVPAAPLPPPFAPEPPRKPEELH
jgi:hypothetical protein